MDYLKELVKFSHLMEEKGYVNAMEGNISLLDRENNKLYITPSGKRKLFLDESMIAVLDFETEEQVAGSLKSSSEYRLHKAAMLARPDVNAVIHCHSTYMTAYALQCKDIEIDSCTAMLAVDGKIPCIPYGMPGTTHIADGLSEVLQKRNICLLGNHGVVCVDANLEDCSKLLETMEETTKTFVISSQFGNPQPIPEFHETAKAFL